MKLHTIKEFEAWVYAIRTAADKAIGKGPYIVEWRDIPFDWAGRFAAGESAPTAGAALVNLAIEDFGKGGRP